MCAIFGIGLLSGHKMRDAEALKKVLGTLAMEAQARGTDATGMAFVSRRNITVVKKDVPAAKIVSLPDYTAAVDTCLKLKLDNKKDPLYSIVGHCRWKTKGTVLNNANNHPIVRDNVIGTHNGVVGNDDNLFNIYSKVMKRNGRVDSEAIFALIEYFIENKHDIAGAIDSAGRTLSGTIAAAMVHKAFTYAVWLFRRTNPCDVLLYKKIGVVVWATSETFIRTAVSQSAVDFGEATKIELPTNSGIGIDLMANKIVEYKFSAYHNGNSNNTMHMT